MTGEFTIKRDDGTVLVKQFGLFRNGDIVWSAPLGQVLITEEHEVILGFKLEAIYSTSKPED